MTSVTGLYSSKKNPVAAPKKVKPMCGPGNAEQAKANKLMNQAYAEKESNRGKSGM
jgi:hypothetical protein